MIINSGSSTSLIQEMKLATRVKTVGLWNVLQPRPSTKLVTPSTYHLPSLPLQFKGPPESPCKIVAYPETWQSIFLLRLLVCVVCHSLHGMPILPLPQHTPCLSLLSCPTSHFDCMLCNPQLGAGPAVAWLPGGRQLKKEIFIHYLFILYYIFLYYSPT